MSAPTITARDVKNACEGMLSKQLYAVFTRPVNGLGPVMKNLDEHLKFQISLEERGVMYGAGPFWTSWRKTNTGFLWIGSRGSEWNERE